MKQSFKVTIVAGLFGFMAASFGSGSAIADTLQDDLASDNEFGSAMLSTDELDENRGTNDSISYNYQFGASYGNTANNTVSGANGINDSFDNASGVISVIQNSGNNVLIQGSTIVNVNMQ